MTTSPGRRPVIMPPGRTAALTALRANELTGIGPPLLTLRDGGLVVGPALAGRNGQDDEEKRQYLDTLSGEDDEVGDARECEGEQDRVDGHEYHIGSAADLAQSLPHAPAPLDDERQQDGALKCGHGCLRV